MVRYHVYAVNVTAVETTNIFVNYYTPNWDSPTRRLAENELQYSPEL